MNDDDDDEHYRLPRGEPIIEMDATPIRVRGEALHPMWWRGRQWAVTEFGIERLDGGYAIEAARLRQGIEEHAFPQHIRKKVWADAEEFTTAWMVALLLHGQAAKVNPERLREIFAALPPSRPRS